MKGTYQLLEFEMQPHHEGESMGKKHQDQITSDKAKIKGTHRLLKIEIQPYNVGESMKREHQNQVIKLTY